jgi:hypothetical protein
VSAAQVDTGYAVSTQQSINRVLTTRLPTFQDLSVTTAQAERAIKPEAIALAAFGAIAGLAALVIAGQAISRQLLACADDSQVLRALGASPAMTYADSLLGILAAVVLRAHCPRPREDHLRQGGRPQSRRARRPRLLRAPPRRLPCSRPPSERTRLTLHRLHGPRVPSVTPRLTLPRPGGRIETRPRDR